MIDVGFGFCVLLWYGKILAQVLVDGGEQEDEKEDDEIYAFGESAASLGVKILRRIRRSEFRMQVKCGHLIESTAAAGPGAAR